MKIFAIGDLHLGSNVEKPMEVFGEKWNNHTEAIKLQWEKCVTDEDLVIICGDISWAMRLNTAYDDLDFIDKLPGMKVCIRGNHDYWWSKVSYLNSLFKSIYFLQNKAYCVGTLAICGTRGWQCPKEGTTSDEECKIYEREGMRLQLSLEDAKKQGAEKIIVALHYPPTNENKEPSLFTEKIKSYPVEQVVYGHLHDEKAWSMCLQGEKDKSVYRLVAADYTSFCPVEIWDTAKE